MLDKHDPTPLYYQLKEVILSHIDSGEWQPGMQLPSERELCAQFRISRITVRQALAELEAHPHTPRLDATMAAMRRLVASRQARVLLVVVPAKEEIYRWVLEGRAPWTTSAEPSGFAQLVRRLATKHGFDYLDLKPRMVGAAREWWERERALLYWRDDTHWNPHGHRIAAAAVAEALSARLAAR